MSNENKTIFTVFMEEIGDIPQPKFTDDVIDAQYEQVGLFNGKCIAQVRVATSAVRRQRADVLTEKAM